MKNGYLKSQRFYSYSQSDQNLIKKLVETQRAQGNLKPLQEKHSAKKPKIDLPLSFQEDIRAHATDFTFTLASKNGTDDWRFKAGYVLLESQPVKSNLFPERARKPPLFKATKFQLQRFIQLKYAGQHNDPKMDDNENYLVKN